MTASHFRELEVWRLSMELAQHVCRLTAEFRQHERYGLSSQLQRAAVSIPSNIAEGNAKGTTRDYARYVSIAKGSCAELQTQLLLAEALDLGTTCTVSEALAVCERVSQMLARLDQSLRRRIEAITRVPGPGSRLSEPAEDY